MTPWERVWLLLILAGCLLLLAAGPVPHIDGDTGLYGKIAKNVLATGEWITLRHRGDWLVDKPPLTIWLMASSLWVFGISNLGLRAWQVPMTVALVWVTYRIARLSAGREEALLAALLVATMAQVLYQSLVPGQDVALALFLALAFYDYARYRLEGRDVLAVRASIWLALAVLSKGIVALAAFGLTVIVDLLASRRRPVGTQHWNWGIVTVGAGVFAAVAAPWFVVGALRQGRPFVDTFFLGGSLGVGRFFHPVLGRPLPAWEGVIAYVPMLILGMLPWTVLLPATIREGWRSLRDGPPALRLCTLWAAGVFLLLSLSTGDKVQRYLLPCFVPLAVVGARALRVILSDPRRVRRVIGVSLAVAAPALGGAALLGAAWFPREAPLYAPIILPFIVVLFLTAAAATPAGLRAAGRRAVAVLAAGTLLAFAAGEVALARQWERIWPWRTVAAIIQARYRPGDRVVAYGEKDNFFDFFVDAPVTFVRDPSTLAGLWETGRVFALFPPGSLAQLVARLHPVILLRMPLGWTLATNG